MKKFKFCMFACLLTSCTSIGEWESSRETNEKSSNTILKALNLVDNKDELGEQSMNTDGSNFTNLTAHTQINAGADKDPDVSNDGRWLAFSSTRGSPTNDIYMNELGTHRVTQLTMDPAEDIHPKMSPDGRSIAFSSNRHDSKFDIYVLPLFDRNGKRIHATPIQITSNDRDNIHPSWSPDGNKLVYSSYNRQAESWEMWVYDHSERSQTMIGYGLLPEWSPDGKHIAYERFRNRDNRFASVWICDPDGSSPTEIVGDRDYGAITPGWSPDGKYIVFATVHKSAASRAEGRVSQGDDIWYIPAIGGTPVQVTTYSGPDSMPVWKLDKKGSSRIFFISNREGDQDRVFSAVPYTEEDLQQFN